MTIDEEKKLAVEKKLVAERLMGWETTSIVNHSLFVMFIKDDNGKMMWSTDSSKWNPQEERKWWDQIWEKMNFSQKERYMVELMILVKAGNTYWGFHLLESVDHIIFPLSSFINMTNNE